MLTSIIDLAVFSAASFSLFQGLVKCLLRLQDIDIEKFVLTDICMMSGGVTVESF